jgi:hypothetical protein
MWKTAQAVCDGADHRYGMSRRDVIEAADPYQAPLAVIARDEEIM